MTVSKGRLQKPIKYTPYHKWSLEDNSHWAEFYRTDSSYLVRFPNLADIEISPNGDDVEAYPVPGVSEQTIDHLLLNLATPLALSQQNKLVFHGSAVKLGDNAVCFLASSGSGKSTLAASFSTNGYQFLSDDCLWVDEVDTGYVVHPSHPSIRLWNDSLEELVSDSADKAPPIDYSPKARILADSHLPYCGDSCPLEHIYFLDNNVSDEVSIKPITGLDVMVELEKNSFILDMEQRSLMNNHFQKLSKFANLPIFFRMEYPRHYGALDKVRKLIIEHVVQSRLRN